MENNTIEAFDESDDYPLPEWWDNEEYELHPIDKSSVSEGKTKMTKIKRSQLKKLTEIIVRETKKQLQEKFYTRKLTLTFSSPEKAKSGFLALKHEFMLAKDTTINNSDIEMNSSPDAFDQESINFIYKITKKVDKKVQVKYTR